MRKISWQVEYDYREPRTQRESNQEKIRTLRWELNVDEEAYYTLEELEEIKANPELRDDEG